MAHIYIIRGIPGSGKTTLAKSMIKYGMAQHHYEADQFMVDDDGDYLFDPFKLKYCHEKCQDSTRKALMSGCDVVVSNTFTKKWEMIAYLDMAKKYDASVTVIVAQGNFNNVLGVPASKVDEMRNRFEY